MNYFEFEKKFPNEESIIKHFIKVRYGNEVPCHHCGCLDKVYQTGRKRYFTCNNCDNTFSIFTGTIFQNSKLDLRKWFYCLHLLLNSKKGISGLQLQREIGGSYHTCWRMLKQIRRAMSNSELLEFRDSIIEVDETYVGGRPRKNTNKDLENNNKRGRGSKKTPVIGVVNRFSKKVHLKVAKENEKGQKLSGKQLLDVITDVAVNDNSNIIMTDEFSSYKVLTKHGFEHRIINHQKEFSDGFIHTNTIESFWSTLKRGILGIYHSVSPKYLDLYVSEFSFRYNEKDNTNIFDTLLKQSVLI